MKSLFIGSTVLLATVLGATAWHTANAEDFKDYAGSGCKVFGSTAWTDLQFGARGIVNKTSSPKNIICPIIKDDNSAWDGGTNGHNAAIELFLTSGDNTKTSTCNVYTADADGTLLNTYSGSTSGVAYTRDSIYLENFVGDTTSNLGSAMVLCTLAANARLQYYYVWEEDNPAG